VDQALALFGPVAEVYAEVARRRPGHGADDDWFLALTHAGGAVSHLGATLHDAAAGLRFRVTGSAGAYEKRGLTRRRRRWATAPARATPATARSRPSTGGA
jgi:hypothetical protein